MGFLDDAIKGAFDGYQDSPSVKKRKYEWDYEELEETPYLFSSGHLFGLVDQAETTDDLYSVRDHLDRHFTSGIESYDNVYSKVDKKIEKFNKAAAREGKYRNN